MATTTKKAKLTLKPLTEKRRKYIAVFIVIFLVAFLLRFDFVAQLVSKGLELVGLDISASELQSGAAAIMFLAAGAIVMYTSIAFAAVTFIGAGLAVVGVSLLVIGIYYGYKSFFGSSENKVGGLT
jgi:hypothetical protein